MHFYCDLIFSIRDMSHISSVNETMIIFVYDEIMAKKDLNNAACYDSLS